MKPAHSLAYWLMPDGLIFPVAILLGVLGLFLRFVGLKRFGGSLLVAALGLTILPVLLDPLVTEIITQVPMWMVAVLLVVLGFYFVRMVLSLFLGKEGAGTLLAMAVAGAMKKMIRLPGLLIKWTQGLGSLLRSPNPGKRALGIALAILLSVLGGLAGGQLRDNGLLPWISTTDVSSGQTTSLSSLPTTYQMGD